MAAQILGTFVRWALMLLATWLIQHGVWTEAQAGQYVPYLVTGVTGILIVLAWSIWQKIKAHQLLKTALEMKPGATVADAKKQIAWGAGAKLLGCFLLATALVLPLAGCGIIHNPFKVPAAVVAANAQGVYTADQVVTRIREFQKLVIDYSRSGIIAMQTGREIVMWTRASMETIGATPDGWQATVKAGWKNIRPKVEKLPAVATWAPIIDALIGYVAPNPILSPQGEAERRAVIGEATRWLLEE